MDKSVIGAKVKKARELRSLSQEQLALALDIPRSAVSDIERGMRGLSASELLAASKCLRRPLDFFLSGGDADQEPAPHFSVRFRGLALKPEDEQVVFDFEQSCRAYAWLEKILEVRPLQAPPAYKFRPPSSLDDAVRQGEELANMERGRLNIGTDPVRDPFQVVESQGIRVFSRKLATENITGIYHHDDELGSCVLVNTATHENRRAFDLMHEYCHVLVDCLEGPHRTDVADDPNDPIERRANAFSAAFLLPRDGVEKFLEDRGVAPDNAPTFADVFHVMVAFGASLRATIVRLQELGYLSELQGRTFKATQDVSGWTTKFRRAAGVDDPDFDHPTRSRFGQLTIRAYAKGEISIGRVAELLGTDISEAREYAWLGKIALDEPVEPLEQQYI